ncbi:MAG: divalent-cation tolerance protein CutA [Methanomicrobiales archaeon]|nr:divalent-cation tolerance protein CutA [Methanomicrobiales archaeon]MDD1663041.1 divalent-cation tolerance protein CutA [Methanomicrobiales archaeon]
MGGRNPTREAGSLPGCGDVKGDRVILVLSTVPESESACITETLVSERLVACANAMPVRSCYRWKGEICREREELLIMKTRESLFARVMDRLRELHPYEVPEILALPVWGGFAGYLGWVMDETGSAGEPKG